VTTMKIKEPTKPTADPNAVLVSICPRCGRLIRGPGLTAIRCEGPQGCGATHDRAAELADA